MTTTITPEQADTLPAETTVKISAVGDNHASVTLPDYVLLAIINAAEEGQT